MESVVQPASGAGWVGRVLFGVVLATLVFGFGVSEALIAAPVKGAGFIGEHKLQVAQFQVRLGEHGAQFGHVPLQDLQGFFGFDAHFGTYFALVHGHLDGDPAQLFGV